MRDEDVYLQIDSHSAFADLWDVTAIAMLRAVPRAESGGVVISTYPADCRQSNWPEALPPVINTATHPGSFFVFSANEDAHETQGVRGARGAPSRQIGGGFLLCVADVIRRVPLDPLLEGVFAEEELLFTARLFTHGIDVVSPRTNIVCHRYAYAAHRAVWDDSDAWTRGTGGYERLRALLRGSHKDLYGPYAMGRERPLSAFWRHIKVSYADSTADPWP
jgi:UDP-GlcNAc:polypeptide alpha-N-acetylglucosaminyltransferase